MLLPVVFEEDSEEKPQDEDETARLNQDEIDALIKELGGG
jgi:hypothetical protein